MHMTNGGAEDGEGRGWMHGGQWRRRKQWTSRPAAGDLWTRHFVIALDPFVFKRSRGGGSGGGGGGSTAENGLQ